MTLLIRCVNAGPATRTNSVPTANRTLTSGRRQGRGIFHRISGAVSAAPTQAPLEKVSASARPDKAAAVSLQGQDLHRSLAGAMFSELPNKSRQSGVVVSEIDRNSNAWAVGLRAGDIIVSVNRREVASIEDFARIVARTDALLIEFTRGDSAYYLTIE